MSRPEGRCHLCGVYGPLSFEHVPPRAAFNDQPVRSTSIDDAFRVMNDSRVKGWVSQRGAGAHTLCARCNSLTGKWYAIDFARWCYQGASVLARSDYRPTLIYLHHILPLRVIKQIFVMCFSVNSERWRERVPELETFVLDRDRRWLSPEYRVFVYYNTEGLLRRVGNQMAIVRLDQGTDPIMVTEITHPPFGYVVTTDGSHPDGRLFEITHFKRYGYNELEVAPLHPEVLPTHLGVPLDYRTKQEINDQAARDAS